MRLLCIPLVIFGFYLLIATGKEHEWHEYGNFYQIYPRSFKDSNGDGVGDLEGVRQKAAYLKELGMDGVWLSPIMKSPMADFGYDISDYLDIDPTFGTLNDFDRLLETFKEHGLHLILDFVPNHTSDEHEWFKKSAARDPEYENYYIWHKGKPNPNGGIPLPPNNWVSVFRFSAWEWHPQRQEYYLHQFAKQQPDLNYREPKVVEAMKNVLRFWLRRGISGFRIDAVPYLFEVLPDVNGDYPDEPLTGSSCPNPNDDCYTQHIYTQNQPETFDMAYQWRDVLNEFKDESKILMIEAYTSLENIIKLYGTDTRDGAQIPFNFELLTNMHIDSMGKDVKRYVDRWINEMPSNRISNWVLGNHDQKRLSSRLGESRADVWNILLQTLPGNAVTYNGEEIDMTDVYISWEDTVDPAACNTNETIFHKYSRDPVRTPFQWDNTKNAGFSTADKTWLPVSANYTTVNVKAQEEATISHLKIFRNLTKLRKTPAFKNSGFVEYLLNDDVYAYTRTDGNDLYVVILNFGNRQHVLNLKEKISCLKDTLIVEISSLNSNLNHGTQLNAEALSLGGEVGIVLKSSAWKILLNISIFLVSILLTILRN